MGTLILETSIGERANIRAAKLVVRINIRVHRMGNRNGQSREPGNIWYTKTKKYKTKIQHDMRWSPLHANKHKQRKQDMTPPTHILVTLLFMILDSGSNN